MYEREVAVTLKKIISLGEKVRHKQTCEEEKRKAKAERGDDVNEEKNFTQA